MELKGGEVGSAVRTEEADEETGELKLPSMSDPPVVTEQPPDPELLELMEEGDAETGGGDDGHKMKILSAIDEPSGEAGYRKSGALDEFAKQFHHWLRLFMMVPFVVLGDRIRAQAAQYQGLRIKLQQARIPVSYEMYVSSSLFYSVIAGIIGAILGLVISFVVIEVIGLPDKITKLTFSESTAWLIDYKWIFLTLFIIVFLSIVLGGIVYVLFLLYPTFKAGERKGDIDRNLPYAVTFMYALSNGGMNIVEIFRSLAECKDTYGEVANEVDTVVRDMEYFGHDLRTALRNTS